ncbi:hypothetical protein DL96DRAFT_1823691 [Flagelloscypha sp. PMI_526]|nr:hypothetical protein DL96DRAFT_1823691 [Flagelloscypha sp. PMI_526]
MAELNSYSPVDPRFPYELLEIVVEMVDSLYPSWIAATTLRSLARANRALWHLCHTRLLHKIILSPSMVSFYSKMFERSPEHASYVRSVGIHGQFFSQSDIIQILEQLAHVRILELGSFPYRDEPFHLYAEPAIIKNLATNIDTLSLSPGSERLFRLVTRFRRLRSLRLDCSWSSTNDTGNPTRPSLPFLKRLLLFNVDRGSLIHKWLLLLIAKGEHDIEHITWSTVNSGSKYSTRRFGTPLTTDDPSFRTLFLCPASTLTSLSIERCCSEDISSFDPQTHPWALNNLPHLRQLTFPIQMGGAGSDKDVNGVDYAAWLSSNFVAVHSWHPLRTLRLLVTMDLNIGFAQLDEALSVAILPQLQIVAFKQMDPSVGQVKSERGEVWEGIARSALPLTAARKILRAEC